MSPEQNAEYGALPAEGCRRHRSHQPGCQECAKSFVARVKWYLDNPAAAREPRRMTVDWMGESWVVVDAHYDDSEIKTGSHWHLTLTRAGAHIDCSGAPE